MTHATPLDRRPGSPAGPTPADRSRTAVELGVLQGLFLLFLVPWFFLAIGGTMGLANWDSPFAALVLLAWWVYPFVALGTTIAAWVLFGTRRHGAARWVNRVPLPWVAVGLALLVWIATAG